MKKYLLSIPVSFLVLFLIYKVNSNAFAYAFLVLLLYCAIAAYFEKKEWLRLFFIYAGSVIMALFIGECYFGSQGDHFSREYDLVYGDDLIRSDSLLGMVPMENSQMKSRAFRNDSLLYEVTINIDRNGRRKTPLIDNDSSGALMFFGGSFTYGDGVEDDETLPYQFQEATKGKYQAYNFGFSGHGAHQTLAILEHGLEKRGASDHSHYFGIYSLITDHVLRGTYSAYNTNSPRYRFDENGNLNYEGLFSKTAHRFNNYLFKSNLVKALNPLVEKPMQKDVDLMIAMLEQSAKIFEKRYQGEFYCLLWETAYEAHEGIYEKIREGLNQKGLKYIEINDILTDFSTDPLQYIIPNDGHPNALANQKIAAYLAEFLANTHQTDSVE